MSLKDKSTVDEFTTESESLKSEVSSSNPFRDPAVAQYWSKIYDANKYECRERFDPEFEWDAKEEKKLIRKLDFKVTLLACFMFVALQVDRGNLRQAISDNMLDDLGLTTNEYNYGNMIFYVSFLAAELPSGIVSKKVGADIFIPIQMVLWSIVAFSQLFMQNKHGFYLTRALIGMLEGGFIPDIVLWLTYFFKGDELPVRLSFFWTTLSLTDIFTLLLAFALLRMRGIQGMAGWRWLFLIEGLFTLVIGVSAGFLMVPSAVQTKKPWNKKGWFTEHEEKIVVNRVLRDDPSKGDMNNRQAITPKLLWKLLTDYDLWPIYGLGILSFQSVNVLSSYLTLNLRAMGFSTFTTNALTIPYNFIHIITLLIVTWVSTRVNDRTWVVMINPIWSIPCLAALRWWPGSMHNRWGTWALTTVALSVPYIHAINVSWCSRNSNSIRTRAVSALVYNMFVQAGSIVSTQIYRLDDLPYYHRGNSQLFGISVGLFFFMLFVKVYYKTRNNYKQRKWDQLTAEQKADYIHNSTDEGNKRLDFRFAH